MHVSENKIINQFLPKCNLFEKEKMKKIIIFGASGGTGRYFIDYCLQNKIDKKFDLIAVGLREKAFENNPRVEYFSIDITNQSDFAKLPSNNIFAVIDLAGVMPARMKGYSPYPYIQTNILGTLNILEYCRSSKTDRILFAQSFGDIKDNAEKNILLKPNSPQKFSLTSDHAVYVISKNTAVQLIEQYHQMYGIKSFIFRLPTIYLYSPIDTYYVDGVERKIGYRIIIDKAIEGKEIEVWGDPSRKKDMVYVKDFCQMMYKALFVDLAFGYYNVGTGIGTTLEDQIRGIIDVFSQKDHQSELRYLPNKPNAPQYIMDIENAKRELSYSPEYNYIEMLEDFKIEMIRQLPY